MAMAPAYPIQVDIDAAAPQNRLSVLLRILYLIPAAIVLAFIGLAAYVVTFIAWFVIVITGSHPEGMHRFVSGALRWTVRVTGYEFLLTDRYPPFSLEEHPSYPIRVGVDPRLSGRNRLTVFFRLIWALPAYIVVTVIGYAAVIVVFIAWFAALFTGSVPAGMHNFVAGYLRWYGRVLGYMLLLCDEYPPFSLN